MAEPARGDRAAAQDPAPSGRPGPGAPFWADVPDTVIANARTAGLVAAELARDPANGAALAMAALLVTALESLTATTRRLADAEEGRTFDEAVLAERDRRMFDEGFTAGQLLRGRLSLVSSG
jgi:hypothetical protein